MTTGWTSKHYEMMTAERDKAIAERDELKRKVERCANPLANLE